MLHKRAVLVRRCTHIGVGAFVIQGVTIGKWATIGAGAVINDAFWCKHNGGESGANYKKNKKKMSNSKYGSLHRIWEEVSKFVQEAFTT
jgi:serine acetyltransferase